MSSFRSERFSRHQESTSSSSYLLRIIGVVFVLVLVFSYSVWSVGNVPVVSKKYIVDKGMLPSVMNDKLGFNVASWRYRLWLSFFAEKDMKIQAGEYKTSTGATIGTFFTDTVKKPIHSDLTITILPGWNIYDIDAYLASKNIGQVGDLLSQATLNFSQYQKDFSFLENSTSLEGFLYPDTYRLRVNATADDAIRTMLGEFQNKIGSSYALAGKDAYRVLILASIVEREERSDINQPIVAGILEKRVKEGIPMGADATVCTGYAKTQKQCTPSFISSVIHDKNPFNTRNKQGYPPTPIANVPLPAWEAASQPQASEFYYYLHDGDGVIHYAKSNTEHVANKQKYLQ